MEPKKDSFADSLFDVLPSYSAQDELLSVNPVPVNIDSAVVNPVARIYLNLPVPHMSQLFDYEIPEQFAHLQAGCRVKVQLGSRKIEGFVVERTDTAATAGKLRPISAVVSNIPVLQPQIRVLLEQLSKEYIAPIADFFPLAVPQRHARAEKDFSALPEPARINTQIVSSFSAPQEYENIDSLTPINLDTAENIKLVHPLPGHDVEIFVIRIQQILERDESVLLLAPTPREAARIANKLRKIFPLLSIAQWTSENNHATRYSQFLSALAGHTKIIVGTRSAIWAPLKQLRLIIQFDDSHSAYHERRNPYINARDVLAARAKIEHAQFCVVSFGPSIASVGLLKDISRNMIPAAIADAIPAKQKTQQLIVQPELIARKHLVPQVLGANQFKYESSPWSRMPSSLFAIVRDGLLRGAVLIVVPKAGYIPKLSCLQCGLPAECPKCGGQIQISAPNMPPECVRCGFIDRDFVCRNCRGRKLKLRQIGSERTALEIGRAFPGVSINLAGNITGLAEVKPGQIIVATPGSEPENTAGYSAAIILDCGYLLAADNANAELMFLRAAAKVMRLVKTRDAGGKVLLVGNVPNNLIDVLGRWDFADWERAAFTERSNFGLPPAEDWFEILGTRADLRRFLGLLQLETAKLNMETKLAGQDDFSESFEFGGPNDPLITGGIHNILPKARILGPHLHKDGILRIFVHPNKEDLPQYVNAIGTVNRIVSINRNALSLRIRRNPPL